MPFRDDIAAIRAAMAEREASSVSGGTLCRPTTGVREGRLIFDTLAAQFETHVGQPVICLPMGAVASPMPSENGG